MRIIKKGVPPKKWTLDITCQHCHAELEIEESDIRYEESNYYCVCPECYARITIHWNKLPSGYKKYIDHWIKPYDPPWHPSGPWKYNRYDYCFPFC